jgi:glucose/arabinose dehydrogenase
MSFDRATGRLWVGDVGQGASEEVSIASRGANLGWPLFEGSLVFRKPTGAPASAFTAPVVEYGRSSGACIIGGFIYRGARQPALLGRY